MTISQANGISATNGGSTGGVVDITGGTIDNTVIGGTTPAAGTFTTLRGSPAVVPFNTTGKALALTDANTIQDCSNSSAQLIAIPSNSSVNLPVNTVVQIEQNGTGIVSVTGATGVTVNGVSAGTVSTGGQFSAIYLRQESINVWYAEGLSSKNINLSSVGTPIASATTIAPVAPITHVTGAAAIATITPPSGTSATVGCQVVLIADGAWTTTTAGNIFATMTATAGIPYIATFDGAKWYIK